MPRHTRPRHATPRHATTSCHAMPRQVYTGIFLGYRTLPDVSDFCSPIQSPAACHGWPNLTVAVCGEIEKIHNSHWAPPWARLPFGHTVPPLYRCGWVRHPTQRRAHPIRTHPIHTSHAPPPVYTLHSHPTLRISHYTHSLLFTTCYLLNAAYYLLRTAYCVLLITHCLLLTRRWRVS